MKLEKLIQKHKPRRDQEGLPAGTGQMGHLNQYGLLKIAIDAQRERSSARDQEPIIVTRLVAWEVLSEAQRNGGLRIVPRRFSPTASVPR